MLKIITFLFWFTLFAICLGYFFSWAGAFLASPFILLIALLTVAAGRSSSQ